MSDFGYGQPDLLAYLLPMLTGQSASADKGILDVQQKATNNVTDLLNLILNPNYAALYGGYDPTLLPQDPQFTPGTFTPVTPTLDAYRQGGDPLLSNVANGLMSGQMSPYQAEITLMNDPTFQSTSGDKAADARKLVDAMWGEVQSVQKQAAEFDASEQKRLSEFDAAAATRKADDPFSKAGLPSPFEEYTAANAPMPDDIVKRAMASQMAVADAKAALSKYTDKSRTDPSTAALLEKGREIVSQPQIGTGAPRSESEARAWAKAAGLDPEDVVQWYSDARYNASVGFNTEKDGKVEYDSDGWRKMGPEEFAKFEKQWQAKVKNKAQVGDGTIFEGITDQTRAGASKLVGPSMGPSAPAAGTGTSPSAVPQSGMDKEKQKLWTDLRKAQAVERGTFWEQQGALKAVKDQGRSPLNDAVQQRVLLLKQLGLI